MSGTDHFSQDTAGLSQSRATEIVDVEPGGSFELRIAPVTKRIGDAEVRMLAYNGSVPGPTLRVAEGHPHIREDYGRWVRALVELGVNLLHRAAYQHRCAA